MGAIPEKSLNAVDPHSRISLQRDFLFNVVVGVVMANGLRGQIFKKEHKRTGIYLIICSIFTIVGGGILLIVAGSQMPRDIA